MTLEELIISFDRPGYTPKKLADAILSWFKDEILPREKSYEHDPKYPFPLIYSQRYWLYWIVYKGYNQCLQDILTNLTAKQGER